MRRRFRRSASGRFPMDARSSLFRMVSFLIVLALIFSWARNPQSWRWLESGSEPTFSSDEPGQLAPNRDDAGAPAKNAAGKTAPAELVVPGPTDQNEAEAAAARTLFQAVTDRVPLAKIEMPAYWRLLKWARAQSFAELERRAAHGVFFTQLWEQPEKYRGKLIRLRLHVRRVLDWEAPENSAGVRRVYEAWGPTDESKSHPYVVVFSDAPPGTPTGDNLQEEGLFVGYFLKTISYTAFNKNRSSPLLLGRMEWLPSAAPAHPLVGRNDWLWIVAVGIPVLLLIAFGTWFQLRRFRRVKLPAAAPADDAEMENWFRNESASSPADEAPHDRPTR
jgi:hypothetical protein